MASPTFSQRDGEVKTVLRIYSEEERQNRYRSECRESFDGCPYKLITPQDSLLPFQFYRPTSVEGITSWTVYAVDGTEVIDFDSDTLSLLSIKRMSGFDAITYNGDALGETLPTGMYYFTIVTAGHTYYSDHFYVQCSPDGDDIVSDPTFTEGVSTDAAWQWGDPSSNTTYERILDDTDNGSGPPTNPAFEVLDFKAATFGDNKLWVWDGATWVMTAPGSGTYWVDRDGNWYRFLAGAWSGVAGGSRPVQITEGESICWDGTINHAPVYIIVNGEETNYRVEVTVTNQTSGSLGVFIGDGISATGHAITANGTYSYTEFLSNGYLIALIPDEDFDGCVSNVHAYSLEGLAACHMKLSWTNCGRVGNIYYPGLTNIFYLPTDTIMPRGDTTIKVESEEDDEGNEHEVSRRKEVVYSMFLGALPWFVADALTEMCLHDTVRLFYPDGTSDALFHSRVEMDRKDQFSKCLIPCTLKFHLFDSSVACCDEFDAPCLTSCADADGFDDDTIVDGNTYLLRNAPQYAVASGGGLGSPTNCSSGLANIVDHGSLVYTAMWDINSTQWNPIASNTLAETVLQSVGGCVVTLRFNVAEGYSGVLQYMNTDEEWVDDEEWILSPSEWSSNNEVREAPEDQDETNTIRLKVLCPNGTTVLGYSEELTYSCE